MACGEAVEVVETYWSICHAQFSYPCGIRWCKKWGVPYPCGVRWCSGKLPYPCRKSRAGVRYCFDFSVVHENCKVFRSKLYGCCNGTEYEWSAACFGWFDAYLPQKRVCLKSPPKELGPCREGYSLPPGGSIPGGPLEDGSVAPHPGGGLTPGQ